MAHAQKPDFVSRRKGLVHLNRRGRQFSRLLAAELCASAVVMLDTPCSEVVWRVLATHSIGQFPLNFPSRASPCAITFQMDSTWLCIRTTLFFSFIYLCYHTNNPFLYHTKCKASKKSKYRVIRNYCRGFNTLRTGDADLHFYITTVQDGWRKSAFLTRACFPCTINLIMQYMEPVSEWSCWRMFIETWPHSELTFRHR